MVMLLIIGIGIVFFILGIFVSGKEGIFGLFLGVIGSWIMLGAISVMQESSRPSAMDVYKGKTTLEITYRDGVPVDSVVVFKNKEK